MKIDLHVHTSMHSACSRTPPELQIQAAIDHGLDGIVIPDHAVLLSPEERDVLQAKFPKCLILRGAEVGVGGEHILFVGGPARTFHETSAAMARAIARETGALTVWNHPFYFAGRIQMDFAEFTPDAV